MSAPEKNQENMLGPQSQERNEELLTTGNIWLQLKSTSIGYLTDRNQRVLAHVFVETETGDLLLVQEHLIREGFAMLDMRQDFQVGDFGLWYTDQLIDAQIDAAFARRGLWSLPAFFVEKDFLIAAINFWSDEEAVYLINRGTESIELAENWVLKDSHAMEHENSRNTLEFGRYFGPSCALPAGETAIIYTGPGTPKEKRGALTGCGTERVELWWFGYSVWNQDGDTCFLLALDGTECACFEYPPYQDGK
jgi:hypothetical protein